VRPVGRSTFLVARFLGAVAVTAPYVVVVDLAAVLITGLTMHWWPDRIVTPPLEVAVAVAVVTALALLGSVFLSSTANGIAIFMLFGAGLVAGLLGTIGHAIGSSAIKHASTVAAYMTPFEALYQDALRQLTVSTSGLTGFLLQLGPFGGAYVHGWPVRLWAVAFLCLVGAAALAAFARRDL
jgi:ABC-type transport system involved in multi-copper enzyme maturation permease subunit